MKNNLVSEKIRHLADSIGIDALGFAEASEFSDYALKDSKRRDPKLSLPNAKTIIVAGIYIGAATLPAWTNPWYGRTSRLYLSECFDRTGKSKKVGAKAIGTRTPSAER